MDTGNARLRGSSEERRDFGYDVGLRGWAGPARVRESQLNSNPVGVPVDVLCLQAALRFLPPGTSAGSINPHFFHPMRNSQVSAGETSRRPGTNAADGALRLHPLNNLPEEAASIRTGGACPVRCRQCLRAFRRTYAIALRTSFGLLSART